MFLTLLTVRLVLDAVERSGTADEVARTPAFQKIRAFATMAARSLGSVQGGAGGLLQEARKRVGGD